MSLTTNTRAFLESLIYKCHICVCNLFLCSLASVTEHLICCNHKQWLHLWEHTLHQKWWPQTAKRLIKKDYLKSNLNWNRIETPAIKKLIIVITNKNVNGLIDCLKRIILIIIEIVPGIRKCFDGITTWCNYSEINNTAI